MDRVGDWPIERLTLPFYDPGAGVGDEAVDVFQARVERRQGS